VSVVLSESAQAGVAGVTVFVGSDRVLGDTLDQAAAALEAAGCNVIRGHSERPPHRTRYELATARRYFEAASVLLISSRTVIDAAMLELAPRLLGVVFASIGTDSIDLPAATDHGIIVANGATAENVESLAEATVMLIAALLLDLPRKQRQFALRSARAPANDLSARMVSGKTIGLIGFGRIARSVTRRLRGWGTEILAYDRQPDHASVVDVRFVGLEELLARSDVVSVHLPLTAATRGLLGPAELARMKREAYVINTSRGGIVDEVALAQALSAERIAGAAIDVFETEPPPVDHPLRGLENVILTEHTVGCTRELFASLAPTAVENVMRVIQGRDPLHIRNPAVLLRWRERFQRLMVEQARPGGGANLRYGTGDHG
jgi:D-3-phosphoglycerate dehydrogenase